LTLSRKAGARRVRAISRRACLARGAQCEAWPWARSGRFGSLSRTARPAPRRSLVSPVRNRRAICGHEEELYHPGRQGAGAPPQVRPAAGLQGARHRHPQEGRQPHL
jgi:hypothetical protein